MSVDRHSGIIYKATGGFYYVRCGGQDYTCRARGLFRKQGISPVVGDWATVEETVAGEGCVVELAPRRNYLVRPPLANLDKFVLVTSVADPYPNYYVLDKMLAIAVHQGMEPILAVTKTDMESPAAFLAHYAHTGFPVVLLQPSDGAGTDKLAAMLQTGVSAFCGNTGVGKSTLLNRLNTGLQLETGETSKKLGRGRHTTRHVELHPFGTGFIADTPGFSAVDMERYGVIPKDLLEDCFPEFGEYLGSCQFTGCSHRVEKGCAVLEGLSSGQISVGRHESYCALYQEAMQQSKW